METKNNILSLLKPKSHAIIKRDLSNADLESLNNLLLQYSECGDIAKVKLLLKYKVNINATNSYKMTSLMMASLNGQYNIVKLLLKYGANPNLIDGDFKTSLQYAEFWKMADRKIHTSTYDKIINALIEHGAVH